MGSSNGSGGGGSGCYRYGSLDGFSGGYYGGGGGGGFMYGRVGGSGRQGIIKISYWHNVPVIFAQIVG
jgi:hypothetical protein